MNTETATISMIDTIGTIACQDSAEGRIAGRMFSHIYDYTNATRSAASFASSVRDSMNRIEANLLAGNRVYDSDVTSWSGRLQEEVTRRQTAADRITETCYLLSFTEQQVTSLWQEIEAKVTERIAGN